MRWDLASEGLISRQGFLTHSQTFQVILALLDQSQFHRKERQDLSQSSILAARSILVDEHRRVKLNYGQLRSKSLRKIKAVRPSSKVSHWKLEPMRLVSTMLEFSTFWNSMKTQALGTYFFGVWVRKSENQIEAQKIISMNLSLWKMA